MVPQEFEIDYNEFDVDGVHVITENICLDQISEVNSNNERKDENIESNNKSPDLHESESLKNHHSKEIPKRPAKKAPKANKENFNFGEASYTDMHNFRVLESERLQKEHELRIKNMAELHNQQMFNLKLQADILAKTLESYK